MQPLSLTLKGFRGIRNGLGRDVLTLDFATLAEDAGLVAIAGANGRGKSTVMDNMHPYLTMPSRAIAGPGGFSYYEHVCLHENEKDLVWAHDGRSYRSQVVIRVNGRRKTEAFLFERAGDDAWKPVVLDDGTVSDGKLDTYTRCVEAICGSADTFFTSVFSAQGKRQLSAYRNAEIKTLLADLLGQEEIRALGQKAAEIARLLKTGLAAIRQEQAGLAAEAQRVDGERQRLDAGPARVTQCLTARQSAQVALESARTRHAQLLAEHEQSHGIEARRRQLQEECHAVIEAGTQAIDALKAQEQSEFQRLERLEQRIAKRLDQQRQRRQALQHQHRQCLMTLAAAPAVRRAEARLSLSERISSLQSARVDIERQRIQRLNQSQASARMVQQQLAAIEREAGQAALKAEELTRRLGLTGEVPCTGSDMQGQCKLLGDARDAKSMMPSAQATIQRLAHEKAIALKELETLSEQGVELADAPQALAWAEQRAERAHARAARFALLAAKAGEIVQARAVMEIVIKELAVLGNDTTETQTVLETPDESAERQQINVARQVIVSQREQQAKHYRATLDRLKLALAALPAPCDTQRLIEARTQMEQAIQAATSAEQVYLNSVRDAEMLGVLTQQAIALSLRKAQVIDRITNVETELSNWNLFAKCMSNDGLIALAIDDAGPALARLANDLLLACYGPRFTVSLQTLVETGKGEQKEGFDILVHDGDSGESKSVGLMSGGERVWVSCRDRHEIHYAESPDMPSPVQSDGHLPGFCQPKSGDATRHKTPSSAASYSNPVGGKSLSLMSGGERTWIEACLVRAIALYLAKYSGRRYTTLFSDEADGPLDPERKRMFMAMKREVLRLGGYEREFFITQTPTLATMADVVIDLDTMCVGTRT